METYLNSAIKRFEYYKTLGEKTFEQVGNDDLFWQFNSESNSIAMIVQHLAGNMLSRWTDFLTSDGEKSSRNRDAEFEPVISNRVELLEKWNEGWACMLNALKSLTENDWEKTIYIRGEAHRERRGGAHVSSGEPVGRGSEGAVTLSTPSVPGLRRVAPP